MRSPLLFRDSALPAPIRFIAGGLLLSLVLAGTLSIVGLERESSGQVSLVRVPDDANQNRPVVADLSGRWTGTIQTKTASTRIYLMLHQNGQSLLGTAGPDSDHQSLIHNMKLVNGTLNFSIGPSSEIHLNLEDDHLVGEIVEVNDVRPNVVLPDETAGFDDIVQKLISAFDETDILALADGHGR